MGAQVEMVCDSCPAVSGMDDNNGGATPAWTTALDCVFSTEANDLAVAAKKDVIGVETRSSRDDGRHRTGGSGGSVGAGGSSTAGSRGVECDEC